MTPRLAPLLLLLALLAPTAPVSASEEEVAEALDGLSGEAIMTLVNEITDDKMLGRKTGWPGGAKIEEWVAQKYAEYGMHPADQAGAYLEPYTFPATQIKGPISLQVAGKTLTYGTDYMHLDHSGAGKVKAPAVFCGFGIHRPDLTWDDYAGVDVKGKIVVVLAGGPLALDWSSNGSIYDIGLKVSTAAQRGAAGLLYVDGLAKNKLRVGWISPRHYQATMPSLAVSEAAVEPLFAQSGSSLKAFRAQVKRAIDATDGKARPSTSFVTTLPVSIEVHTDHAPKALGHNVLARFDGRDPDLKHEVVLVGSFCDAQGVAPTGASFQGASANASGTAVLLHLADLISLNKYRPKRTLVFCAFTGATQSFRGSRALVQRLPFPGTVVAMVNINEVGLTGWPSDPEPVRIFGRSQTPSVTAALGAAPTPIKILKDNGREGDHSAFAALGVPAFRVTTAPSEYAGTLQDTTQHIKPACLASAANAVGRFLIALGSFEQPLGKKEPAEAK